MASMTSYDNGNLLMSYPSLSKNLTLNIKDTEVGFDLFIYLFFCWIEIKVVNVYRTWLRYYIVLYICFVYLLLGKYLLTCGLLIE